MLFTRGNQYAIQALVLLAMQPRDKASMCRDLADTLSIPYPYLSKLMQQCAKLGLVGASRGRTGGYWLLDRAEGMSIFELIEAINGERHTRECLLGFKECADDSACVMHCEWKPVKEGMFAVLKEQSLGQLADAVRDGRCVLGDLVSA
ncbi:MAG: Rrf2 family transcriptional regulator [Gallionellaceae bacterium]|nr:Rrf2 family transcriptional regulator [Gallionellaceae bacterium]MDD5365990.1 Rrf2 family transcriptional regulator [Gallionellaceae bacterium]